MKDDKQIELRRYQDRASYFLSNFGSGTEVKLGSKTMPAYLRAPYLFYDQSIKALFSPRQRVLELGSGMGLHTLALLRTGAQITASDISYDSLRLLRQPMQSVDGNLKTEVVNIESLSNLKTEVADMESLPFDDSSFDIITSAGSLSYGAPYLVDIEIRRVLRPGGTLICVDSLNHNPVLPREPLASLCAWQSV